MYDKPIKQFGAIQPMPNQANNPVIPNQFQTGTYYNPTEVVQQPPMQPGMGNQMGTYPVQKKNCKY